MSSQVELWAIAVAAVALVAATLWAVWLVRARLATARFCTRALESLPAPELPAGLDLSLPVPAAAGTADRSVPAPSLFDPRRLSVEKVAVLDAINAAYVGWLLSEQGSTFLAAAVQRIPEELLQAGSILGAGMDRLGHLAQSTERLFQAALPVELWQWLDASHVMDLAHAVEQKVNLLESGHALHFTPDSASSGFDLGLHFPWMTAILSGTREVRLVSRGDTTVGRALAHIALDVCAVSAGILAGSAAAGLVAAGVTFLDFAVTGGMFTLLTGICGAGGAFAGARAAKKMRFMRLEELSEQYARLLAESTGPLESARQVGQSRLAGVYDEFTQRRAAMMSDLEAGWNEKLAALSTEWDALGVSLHARAAEALRSGLAETRSRLERVDAQCQRRGWLLWWPAWENVLLWTERRLLRRTVPVLANAERRLKAAGAGEAKIVLAILEEAAAEDPLTSVGPLLASFSNAVLELVASFNAIREDQRVLAGTCFASLEREREIATTNVLRTVAQAVEPILGKLRGLEDNLRREARALGASFA